MEKSKLNGASRVRVVGYILSETGIGSFSCQLKHQFEHTISTQPITSSYYIRAFYLNQLRERPVVLPRPYPAEGISKRAIKI
jgi:hypothetical protein